MKKMLLVVAVLLLFVIPASADTIDLTDMSREELIALRDEIDEQLAALDAEEAIAEEPDYTTLPLEDAFVLIGQFSGNDECTFRNYELWDTGYYLVHVNLPTPYSYETGLVNAVRFTIDFGRRAFTLKGVNTLRFEFHQETRDKYGNVSEGSPIIWKIKDTTFGKMNIDYFYEHTYSTTKKFMDACDSAAVYVEYKRVAK